MAATGAPGWVCGRRADWHGSLLGARFCLRMCILPVPPGWLSRRRHPPLVSADVAAAPVQVPHTPGAEDGLSSMLQHSHDELVQELKDHCREEAVQAR